MSDHVTGFITKDGIKKYDYRALANLPESVTDITSTVISPNADYAEVGEWADGNPDRENRLGYFVAIAAVGDNTIKIRKATSTDDVRGVSVYNPAFSGNASRDKYGEDGELLPQYNYIGVLGIVKIIDNGCCSIGGRCMPADDGTAIPSNNNMGYAVLERVDSTHVLIAVEPGADMIQRVKTDVQKIEDQIADGTGLTEEQAELLTKLSEWYDNENYEKIAISKLAMSPATTTYEIGASQSVRFSWAFNKVPSTVTFNNVEQTAAQEGSTTLTVARSLHTAITYKLYGKYAEGEEVSGSISIKFRNKFYRGVDTEPKTVDSTFIKGLSDNGWAESKTTSFTPTCTSGNYVWYAYPKRLGTAIMWIGGFQGGFEEPLIVPVTNRAGFTEDYYVYRSINSGIGKLSIEAK